MRSAAHTQNQIRINEKAGPHGPAFPYPNMNFYQQGHMLQLKQLFFLRVEFLLADNAAVQQLLILFQFIRNTNICIGRRCRRVSSR